MKTEMQDEAPFWVIWFLPPSFDGLLGAWHTKIAVWLHNVDDLTPFKMWAGWIAMLPAFGGTAVWYSVWLCLSLVTACFLARAIKE